MTSNGPTPTTGSHGGDRPHDLVLFGATGYVGRLLCAYLAGADTGGLRIAIAGRNRGTLDQLRTDLGDRAQSWAIIVADAHSPAAMDDLASSTRVVVTTVGPYTKYGQPLVRACAAHGTDYADLTGEILFVADTIATCEADAAASGARIVHCCGFDSVPSDLGVLVTAQAAQRDGSGPLTDTLTVVTGLHGGFSGGTVDSRRNTVATVAADPQLAAITADPFALNPDRSSHPGPARGADRDVHGMRYDRTLGMWLAPFVMAGINTRIVRRSNALNGYGPDFSYQEVVGYRTSVTAPIKALGTTAMVTALPWAMRTPLVRTLLDRALPDPGEGPSADKLDAGSFRFEIYADTESGDRYRTVVAADGDPGYAGTAVMLGQSALCLALDGPLGARGGGVLTPATAMGDTLVDRLMVAGFTFDTHRLDR